MRRNDAIDLLRHHRDELAGLGVGQLYLYGSVARDAADNDSDIDLLITPNHDRFSLFDLMRVQDVCTSILNHITELHDFRGLARAPDFRASIEADLVNVF